MYLWFGKRLFDILTALVALIILLPLMFVISVLIIIVDPGPVLFIQIRIGRNGNPFRFYKFRSMPVGTVEVSSDQLGEIRLSLIGKLIRRTNIDELPQLFNILLGDMSLVGPRPPIPQQEELLKLRSKTGAISCRPGLTGLAQVKSYDGMSIAVKARYDEEYSQKITFWRDFTIILQTLVYLFKKPPVY